MNYVSILQVFFIFFDIEFVAKLSSAIGGFQKHILAMGEFSTTENTELHRGDEGNKIIGCGCFNHREHRVAQR